MHGTPRIKNLSTFERSVFAEIKYKVQIKGNERTKFQSLKCCPTSQASETASITGAKLSWAKVDKQKCENCDFSHRSFLAPTSTRPMSTIDFKVSDILTTHANTIVKVGMQID